MFNLQFLTTAVPFQKPESADPQRFVGYTDEGQAFYLGTSKLVEGLTTVTPTTTLSCSEEKRKQKRISWNATAPEHKRVPVDPEVCPCQTPAQETRVSESLKERSEKLAKIRENAPKLSGNIPAFIETGAFKNASSAGPICFGHHHMQLFLVAVAWVLPRHDATICGDSDVVIRFIDDTTEAISVKRFLHSDTTSSTVVSWATRSFVTRNSSDNMKQFLRHAMAVFNEGLRDFVRANLRFSDAKEPVEGWDLDAIGDACFPPPERVEGEESLLCKLTPQGATYLATAWERVKLSLRLKAKLLKQTGSEPGEFTLCPQTDGMKVSAPWGNPNTHNPSGKMIAARLDQKGLASVLVSNPALKTKGKAAFEKEFDMTFLSKKLCNENERVKIDFILETHTPNAGPLPLMEKLALTSTGAGGVDLENLTNYCGGGLIGDSPQFERNQYKTGNNYNLSGEGSLIRAISSKNTLTMADHEVVTAAICIYNLSSLRADVTCETSDADLKLFIEAAKVHYRPERPINTERCALQDFSHIKNNNPTDMVHCRFSGDHYPAIVNNEDVMGNPIAYEVKHEAAPYAIQVANDVVSDHGKRYLAMLPPAIKDILGTKFKKVPTIPEPEEKTTIKQCITQIMLLMSEVDDQVTCSPEELSSFFAKKEKDNAGDLARESYKLGLVNAKPSNLNIQADDPKWNAGLVFTDTQVAKLAYINGRISGAYEETRDKTKADKVWGSLSFDQFFEFKEACKTAGDPTLKIATERLLDYNLHMSKAMAATTRGLGLSCRGAFMSGSNWVCIRLPNPGIVKGNDSKPFRYPDRFIHVVWDQEHEKLFRYKSHSKGVMYRIFEADDNEKNSFLSRPCKDAFCVSLTSAENWKVNDKTLDCVGAIPDKFPRNLFLYSTCYNARWSQYIAECWNFSSRHSGGISSLATHLAEIERSGEKHPHAALCSIQCLLERDCTEHGPTLMKTIMSLTPTSGTDKAGSSFTNDLGTSVSMIKQQYAIGAVHRGWAVTLKKN